MFINITDNKQADNKGSSSGLVNYLEKENRIHNSEQEYWFNGSEKEIEAYQVMRKIDGNVAKLGKDDAKFFLINISPSQKELAFLRQQFSEKGEKDHMKLFASMIMDAYAENFKRRGIKTGNDLVWYGKLENYRYYNHNDPEVKQGLKKRGERKPGDQMHVQVIVSRKDATNKIKLSPQNTSRGKNTEHSKKMGQFDRVAFKQSGEFLFDRHFGFERNLKDTLAYANIQKNGNLLQREQLEVLKQGSSENRQRNTIINELASQVAKGAFSSVGHLLESTGKLAEDFLGIMMEPPYIPDIAPDTAEEAEKKRKKKARQQGQGLQR